MAETALGDKCLLKEIDGKCYYLFANATDWQENYDLCEGQQLEMVRLSNESFSHMAQLRSTNRNFDFVPRRYWNNKGRWLAGRALVFSKLTDLGIKVKGKY